MKKITIKEVAEEAGVSKTTISRFLNNNYGNMSKETKEKIAEVIERLNYRPSKQAQALKSKHSYLIGVVVADISNLYSSLLLKGIGSILEKSGYQMIIVDAANSVKQEKELLEKLIDQNVEGIILQPSSRQTANYNFITERNIPLLLVDRQTEPEKWSSVMTNNIDSTQEVIEKALAKGYENVVVISEPVQDVSTRELRYETVKKTMEKAGKGWKLLEVTDEDQLTESLSPIIADTRKNLLFASNGRVLMDVLAWLIQQGIKIPEDVGITGFDDWNLTELVGPGITSIEQPSREIGKIAGQYLMDLLIKPETQQEIIVPSVIRWRKSV
ncbi:LacI family DNA-binding transcriptional regulator [Enterococcus raffinosus]|uniref:LacI family DNA-binding transcriptional regulator n=1 Tax=Enterococcus raffinosus TaxID=71452 RepID=A0AAW8T612_9ENTE|nr:LacI family DNA-binding transcriptional regulator [Enterococcus raffinosus]MDT2522504.1 LacI family DNA-binding transcriptional regulator [Enterococcus raffinosus]MDT2530405.1 LacI family DNA-binding transcriptional regulator [Enterococcus raffinosus]MDT2533579.1 LacI family DNA-binding transcriptional regulator [Enterococcus raffinosus]MDT2543134.1 LacI family DNA-binding transcriptional regulator [Enterococcus raffinosus]MDT2553124.1 LacI family DNA-binding transcriptional regulator [Ente